MLYTVIDLKEKKVVDVGPTTPAEEEAVMQELTEMYNQLTGFMVQRFDTIEEAKEQCLNASRDRLFGRTPDPKTQIFRPPWLREDGKPTHDPPLNFGARTQKQGPIAKAREIFASMWGSPRKEIIEACAKVGIKRSTASTQYQHFKKSMEMSGEHKNPDNGMPQLPPGARVGSQDRPATPDDRDAPTEQRFQEGDGQDHTEQPAQEAPPQEAHAQ